MEVMEGFFAEGDVYSGKDHLQGGGEQTAGYGGDLRGGRVYDCAYFVSLFEVYSVGCLQEGGRDYLYIKNGKIVPRKIENIPINTMADHFDAGIAIERLHLSKSEEATLNSSDE